MAVFKRQFTDQDGDSLNVSRWPAVSGVVFETRFKGENVGAMVELSDAQVEELITFLNKNRG